MARPKRMGAFSALDELLPGPPEDSDRGDPPGRPAARRPARRPRAVNALDELLPGPGAVDPAAEPDWMPWLRSARPAWDPDAGGRPDAGEDPPARRDHPAGRGGRPRLRSVPSHLDAWNPLDDLRPGRPPAERAEQAEPARREPAGSAAPGRPDGSARTRMTVRVPADLAEAARDAVAHLAASGERQSLTALAERALRAELARLASEHNAGRPFPPRR